MEDFRMLLVLAACAVASGGETAALVSDDAIEVSCPDPTDISPCVCTADSQGHLDVDCSDVEDEDELARVFSASFPTSTLRELRIVGNPRLRALRAGDLGVASFQVIWIESGVLEEVQSGALSQSYSTATRINIRGNKLSNFPFSELPLFTSLNDLWLDRNSIAEFPALESATITDINLSKNLFSQIPLEGFRNLPNIHKINVGVSNLGEIAPGTFSNLLELSWIYLFWNDLTHIPGGAIELAGAHQGNVFLQLNGITSVSVGGITGLRDGNLNLEGNSLTQLDEDVFRPLLEEGATLFLADNPLNCGCEIAWLVTNATFMDNISSDTACYDRELLSNLDPAMFDKLC